MGISGFLDSCFFDKFFFTLWAADSDFPLAFGNSYRLLTTGTGKITMLPVLDPLQEGQILPILLITLIGIPGEHAENGNTH